MDGRSKVESVELGEVGLVGWVKFKGLLSLHPKTKHTPNKTCKNLSQKTSKPFHSPKQPHNPTKPQENPISLQTTTAIPIPPRPTDLLNQIKLH